MNRVTSVLMLTAYLLAGCTAPRTETTDPLVSLTSPEPSSTFTEAFWTGQAKNGTVTWRQAVDFCGQDGHRELPNCESVGQVQFLKRLREAAKRTSKPYDGQGGVALPEPVARTLETGADPPPPESGPRDRDEE